MCKRSLTKRNIKPSWIFVRISNQFFVTSAWKNSWIQLSGLRNDWPILAVWLLLLLVILYILVDSALPTSLVAGDFGVNGGYQPNCLHH